MIIDVITMDNAGIKKEVFINEEDCQQFSVEENAQYFYEKVSCTSKYTGSGRKYKFFLRPYQTMEEKEYAEELAEFLDVMGINYEIKNAHRY